MRIGNAVFIIAVAYNLILGSVMIVNAATYEKVDDRVKITETKEVITEVTIAELEHEISGIDYDISVYQAKIDECNLRKEKYRTIILEAEKLGILSPAIEEKPDNPIG